MEKVNGRYIVNNVDTSITFYTEILGFKLDMHPAPGFARLSKGNLQLLLNKPGAGGAGQSTNDGRVPAPGGWNRFCLPKRTKLERSRVKKRQTPARAEENAVGS